MKYESSYFKLNKIFSNHGVAVYKKLYTKPVSLFLSDFTPTYLQKSEKLLRISTHHLNFQKNIEKNIEKSIRIVF